MLPFLQERYLAAVADHDVTASGGRLATCIDRLTFAQAAQGAWDTALRTLDGGKSLRLRHRLALRTDPAGRDLLALERSIHVVTRGVDSSVPGAALMPGADVLGADGPAMTRLLEDYRAARTHIQVDVTASPSIADVAGVLEAGEAAVVLGVHTEGTVVAVIVAGDADVPREKIVLTPSEGDWVRLLIGDDAGGWLPRLGQADGSAARLAPVLQTADAWLGRPLATMLSGLGVDRAVVIPHKALHLLPFSALPALSGVALGVAPSAAQFVALRAGPTPAVAATRALVVCDPTMDLPVSTVEGESARRHLAAAGIEVNTLAYGDATEAAVARALPTTSLLHIAGHAQSDLIAPLRSALVLSPGAAAADGDPFDRWLALTTRWEDDGPGESHADIPGEGRLHRRTATADLIELSMDAGSTTTLWARYRDGLLVDPGVAALWTAGDIAVLDPLDACQLVVLSACESGVTAIEVGIDEFSGLPAALTLAGAESVIATLWPVSETLAAVFVDLLYRALGQRDGAVELRRLVRDVQDEIKCMPPSGARRVLLQLADTADDPRAALTLERFAEEIDPAGPPPFADPWEWAAFFVSGRGQLRMPQR